MTPASFWSVSLDPRDQPMLWGTELPHIFTPPLKMNVLETKIQPSVCFTETWIIYWLDFINNWYDTNRNNWIPINTAVILPCLGHSLINPYSTFLWMIKCTERKYECQCSSNYLSACIDRSEWNPTQEVGLAPTDPVGQPSWSGSTGI